MKLQSQRDLFWDVIYEKAKLNRDIIVVSADMGAPSLDKFRADLGSQFINTGIAEQNTIGVAAGLAMTGKKVFAYAIAPFITFRCYDHIKCLIANMNLPVTLVGVGAGISYEESGPTHHTVEDLSVMRVLPNFTIHTPSDRIMAGGFAEICCKGINPNYIRLDRGDLPIIHSENEDFSKGFKVLKESDNGYIIATGNMVHNALEAANKLEKQNFNIGVIDLYTLPLLDEQLTNFVNTVKESKKLITLEEHTLPGGLGSTICEIAADNTLLIPIQRIGFNFQKGYCYHYGGRAAIQEVYNLDADSIAKLIIGKTAA